MVTVGRKPATWWKIGVGVFLLLFMASNSNKPLPDDAAGALGAFTGNMTTFVCGIALVVAGLPKTLGNPEFTKRRYRLWLKYMGLGFVLSAIVAVVLFAISFDTSAVLVWLFYWFVWSWLSWNIADREMATRQFAPDDN